MPPDDQDLGIITCKSSVIKNMAKIMFENMIFFTIVGYPGVLRHAIKSL